MTPETPNETQETTPTSLDLRLNYPQNVTRGETFEVDATILNTGTSAAGNVALDWSIPEGFTLATGNQNGFCGTIETGNSCRQMLEPVK